MHDRTEGDHMLALPVGTFSSQTWRFLNLAVKVSRNVRLLQRKSRSAVFGIKAPVPMLQERVSNVWCCEFLQTDCYFPGSRGIQGYIFPKMYTSVL